MSTVIEDRFRKYLIPLVISSTLLGVAGGAFPFLWGIIPGGIAGCLVAPFWYRIMCRRAESKSDPQLIWFGTLWGAFAGFLSTLFLHGCLFAALSGIVMSQGSNDTIILAIEGIVVMIGIPIGLIAGGILGAIFGTLFQRKYDSEKQDLPQDNPDASTSDATN